MKDLKEIVQEIEKFSKFYRETDDKIIRGLYNNRVDEIISKAPKSQTYELHNYYARLIRWKQKKK